MKNKTIYLLLIVYALVLPFTILAQQHHQLSNPKVTKEAKAFFAYINIMKVHGKK